MKKQNGITLISLIITIIIMLILAGVSLSMVMGDGSMLEQANVATTKTKVAEVQEYIDLAVANNKLAKYSKIGLKSKESLAAEMFSQGLITEAEKNKMLADEELKINDVVINYSEVKTTYDEAISAGGLTLSGEWLITESLNLIDNTNLSQEIRFTTRGGGEGLYANSEYYDVFEVTFANIEERDLAAAVEFKNIADGNMGTVYISHWEPLADKVDELWYDDNYRYVDFGTTPQSVSQEFYDWFTANATKN